MLLGQSPDKRTNFWPGRRGKEEQKSEEPDDEVDVAADPPALGLGTLAWLRKTDLS